MVAWEYKVVEIEPSPLTSENEKILNTLGREGWELVPIAAIETTTGPIEGAFAYLEGKRDSFD